MTSSLRSVVDVLRASNIDYALIGAGAMAAHGVPRSTLDTDLLVLTRDVLSKTLWDKSGVTLPVSIALGDETDPLDGVVRIQAPEGDIEIVVPRGNWAHQAVKDASVLHYLGQDLRVAQIADLVVLKLIAGGYRDQADIALLIESFPDQNIASEVDARSQCLDEAATNLWAKIRGSVTT